MLTTPPIPLNGFTPTDLATAMEKSGRRLTARTARQWWSAGLLPRPQRVGRGRGAGSASLWPDRKVLSQAELAHDLLGRGASQGRTAAGLWLVGFPVPFEVVRTVFMNQIADDYRRAEGPAGVGLESGVWDHALRFAKADARARGGSMEDEEGAALYSLTGELLELLCGVQDSGSLASRRQWSIDTAAELLSQLELLRPYVRSPDANAFSVINTEAAEEVVAWIRDHASLQCQQDSVANARPHDWVRARRLTRLAVGLLDRADAAASPGQHRGNRRTFTPLIVAWAYVLFPIVLTMVRVPQQRRAAMRSLFTAAATVRRGPRA